MKPRIPSTFAQLESSADRPDPGALPGSSPGPTGGRDSSRYTVLGELARGGLGRVSAATDDQLGRPVAIKEPIGNGPDALTRFEREARLTSRLQHAGVVPIYDVGTWPDGRPYFVMKMVEGRSLAELIRDTPSPEGRLALLPRVLAAAETMAYAHGRGIIHRDLKPSNVIVSDYGETVVIDWGLARQLVDPDPHPGGARVPPSEHNDPAVTQIGRIFGTPPFMPPEQADGQPVDQSADVYALGAILYTVLGGQGPYTDGDLGTVLARVRQSPPTPLRSLYPAVPHELAAIVERAMARRPAQRYPGAALLAEDLRRFLDGQLVSAHAYSAGELARRWLRRHRATVIVAAVLLSMLAAASLLAVRRIIAERNAALQARAAAEAGQAALVLMQAEQSLRQDPTASRDWLARLPAAAEPNWLRTSVAEEALALGAARRVIDLGDGCGVAHRSPSTPRLAVGCQDGRVRMLTVESGAWLEAGRHPSAVVTVALSSRDHLASLDREGRVRLLAGGVLRLDEVLGPSTAANLTFAPQGDRLAVGHVDRLVTVMAVDHPERRLSFPLSTRASGISFCPDSGTLVVSDDAGLTVALAPGAQRPRPLAAFHAEARLLCLPGGRFVTAGVDGAVKLGELESGQSRVIGRHDDWVSVLVAAPDGGRVASGSGDGSIRVFDLPAGQMRLLRDHPDTIRSLVFVDRGRRLASLGRDGEVRLWDAEGKVVFRYRTSARAGARLEVSPDESRLIVLDAHQARVLPLEHRRVLVGAADRLVSLRFDPGASSLIAGARDRRVHRWDLATGRHQASSVLPSWIMDAIPLDADRVLAIGRTGEVNVLDSHLRRRRQIVESGMGFDVVSPDGRRLAYADFDGVIVQEIVSGRRTRLQGRQDALQFTFTADSARVAVANQDGLVGLWRAEDGVPIRQRQLPDRVEWVTVSPGQQWAALAQGRTRLRLWQLGPDRLIDLPDAGTTDVPALFVDDTTLVTSLGNLLRVTDLRAGRTRLLRGHRSTVSRLVRSPAGPLLASSDVEGFVRVWNLASTGAQVLALPTGPPDELVFSDDGRWLAAGVRDGAVHLWQVPPAGTEP